MIKIYKLDSLGSGNIAWLKTKYHFSFADYYNQKRMGFGKLRVINDDIIKAGTGFDTHPHRDMEIITYVRKGAITHKDSVGNKGRTEAGDVQVMSAGTGIFHSEYNEESEDTVLYQIWIVPDKKGVKPAWDAAKFPKKCNDNLQLLVSGRKEDSKKEALRINQDAAIYGGMISSGKTIKHPIKYQAYILVSEGRIEINGHIISQGDGAEVTDAKSIDIKAIEQSEVVVIDVPA